MWKEIGERVKVAVWIEGEVKREKQTRLRERNEVGKPSCLPCLPGKWPAASYCSLQGPRPGRCDRGGRVLIDKTPRGTRVIDGTHYAWG